MTVALAPERLESVELFHGLSGGDTLEILAACDDLAFNAGDAVFETGEELRALYVVLEGEVEIDLVVSNISERVIAQLGPGSVFGEMSFFHASPHAATARCLTAARVARLTREQFDTFAADNPSIALRITANAAGILAARLQHTDQWVVETLSKQHAHDVRENWRKLREGMMASFRPPTPFISIGGPVLS